MGRKKRFISVVLVGFSLLFCLSCPVFGAQPDESLALAAETGRPLLATVTSPSCPPCQVLKYNLANDGSIQPIAEQYIVLNLDSRSQEFQAFRQKYPVEFRGVPMVFLIRPDGVKLYGQSGGLLPETLRDLLQFGLDASGAPLTSEQQQMFTESLAAAELHLRHGDLLKALRKTTFVFEQPCFASSVLRSRDVRNSILDAMHDRLAKLDERLVNGETMHGAAFRLVELYAGMGDVSGLRNGSTRERAKAMLLHYQQQDLTRLAVAQGVELVRAREHERRRTMDRAIASYNRIIALDEASPTAVHAVQRLTWIKARQRGEIASRASSL